MIFSIIIPAKNEENNMPLCLEALIGLYFPKEEYEIIIVDNGSSDSTVSIARKYGFPVYVKPHLSLSGLRNFGASVAMGEILVFLDADCVPDPNWLNNAALTLVDHEVGCTGSTPAAPTNGTWVEKVWSSFRTRRSHKCYAPWINSSNFIVRRDIFNKIGGFNINVKTCEDVDICMRLNKICKILFDPTIKVVHLGEPKTLIEFLTKEIWRGKGAISGVISHGISLSEIKSLLIPLYYFVLLISIAIAILLFNRGILFLLLFLYLLPALTFSVCIIIKTKKYNYILGYIILFLVYVNARTIALFLR